MEDIIFAVGAQLSSYNWQNYEKEEKNIWNILSEPENMQLLLRDEPNKFINSNTATKIEEKKIEFFKEFDKRLLMFYSEDIKNENYLFKSIFEEFSLIEGTNHSKIYNETNIEVDKYWIDEKNLRRKIKYKFSSAGISKEANPFKAFAVNKGKDVIISFHYEELDENSFYIKNYGFWELPEAILCAIYFYNKIVKLYPKSNVYLTGENIGGVLAEFITIYSEKTVKNTVVWNSLLIDRSSKIIVDYRLFLREKKLEYKEVYDSRSDEYWINDCKLNDLEDGNQNPYRDLQQIKLFQRYLNYSSKINNLKNYYFYEEQVEKYLGELIFIVKKKKNKKDNEESEIFIPRNYVFNINNFLPFFDDSGNIKLEFIRNNYIYNFVKTLFLDKENKLKRFIKTKWEEEEIEVDTESVLLNMIENKDENLMYEVDNSKENIILQEILKNKYDTSKKDNSFFVTQGKSEKEKYILGQDSNYISIGGVVGGLPMVLSSTDASNAKRAVVYESQNGDSVIKDTGEFRDGMLVLNGMQIGISAVFEKIDDNSWKEYLGFLDISYYYDENKKDLIIEWEFLD